MQGTQYSAWAQKKLRNRQPVAVNTIRVPALWQYPPHLPFFRLPKDMRFQGLKVPLPQNPFPTDLFLDLGLSQCKMSMKTPWEKSHFCLSVISHLIMIAFINLYNNNIKAFLMLCHLYLILITHPYQQCYYCHFIDGKVKTYLRGHTIKVSEPESNNAFCSDHLISDSEIFLLYHSACLPFSKTCPKREIDNPLERIEEKEEFYSSGRLGMASWRNQHLSWVYMICTVEERKYCRYWKQYEQRTGSGVCVETGKQFAPTMVQKAQKRSTEKEGWV